MKITILGIDLTKNVFQLHGVDANHRPALKKKIKRAQLAECVANLPPCQIFMESCIGAYAWGRKFIEFGQQVKLIGNLDELMSEWLKKLIERRGISKATVALANKNARVIWALMAREENYRESVKAA